MLDITLPLQLQDFITLFLTLIVEAFPFVIIGVSVSALVGIFVTPEIIARLVPKNTFLAHLVVSLLGMFMPVCECGNVPVVRRMIISGVTVPQAITFLLAAPIINPITLWSTAEAFGWDSPIPYTRLGVALIISIGVGLFFTATKDQDKLLADKFYDIYCDHDHHQGETKLDKGLNIFYEEFIVVMRALCVGAIIAAASQAFLPREWILQIGANPVLSVVAMLILAFVISICANVDAFVAITYASSFTLGSILSFLVFGPMVDIKMLSMLGTTFTVKTLLQMSTLILLASAITGLVFNLII